MNHTARLILALSALLAFSSCRNNPFSHFDWKKQGEVLIEKFEYDNALKLYQEQLTKDPANIAALNGAGRIFMIKHQFDDAFDAYGRSLELDSANLDAYLGLARSHTARGDFDLHDNVTAVEILLLGYNRYPKSIPLCIEMSRCYGLCYDYTNAVEMARRAVAIDPADTNAQRQLRMEELLKESNRDNIFAR